MKYRSKNTGKSSTGGKQIENMRKLEYWGYKDNLTGSRGGVEIHSLIGGTHQGEGKTQNKNTM